MAQQTEILIQTVQNYPVLYDTSHADYKNTRIKNRIWDNIAEIIGDSDGNYFFNGKRKVHREKIQNNMI